MYLNKVLTKDMMIKLNSFFELDVEVQRIRHGNKQTVETLISEEALLLARYLRNERPSRVPRVPCALKRSRVSNYVEQSSG